TPGHRRHSGDCQRFEWGFNVSRSDVVWHAPVKGKANLPRFFTSLQQMDIRAFEPRAFFTDHQHVAALIHIDYTVRKTERRVVEDQIHLWRFDADGKVASLQHFEDTAQVLSAFAG